MLYTYLTLISFMLYTYLTLISFHAVHISDPHFISCCTHIWPSFHSCCTHIWPSFHDILWTLRREFNWCPIQSIFWGVYLFSSHCILYRSYVFDTHLCVQTRQTLLFFYLLEYFITVAQITYVFMYILFISIGFKYKNVRLEINRRKEKTVTFFGK